MSEQPITIPTTDGGEMPAHLWLPVSGAGPGIVLFQEIFGVTAYIERRASDLAEAGYVVVAPEFYWRIAETEPLEGADKALQEGMARVQRLDWPDAARDGAAAVRYLRGRPETEGHVGVVGFCFGGGLAFNVAAVEPVDCLVSYYGSALPGLLGLAPQVTIPSQHHFGLADSFIDNETVRRIEAAVNATEFNLYEGADHAFDNNDGMWFNAEASQLAWKRTLGFLQQHLPTPVG